MKNIRLYCTLLWASRTTFSSLSAIKTEMKYLGSHKSTRPAYRCLYQPHQALLVSARHHLWTSYRDPYRNSNSFLATVDALASGKGNGGYRLPTDYLRAAGAGH